MLIRRFCLFAVHHAPRLRAFAARRATAARACRFRCYRQSAFVYQEMTLHGDATPLPSPLADSVMLR